MAAELTISTTKIAALSVVSRELIQGRRDNAQLLYDAVGRSVTQKADAVFVSAVNAATGLVSGTFDPAAPSLDPIVEALVDIRANYGEPSAVLMNGTAWKALLTLKSEANSNLPVLGVSTDPANSGPPSTLYGLPVYVHNDAAAVYVFSRPDMLAAAGGTRLEISTDRYFENDAIGVRAIARLGVGFLHANRHARLDPPVTP